MNAKKSFDILNVLEGFNHRKLVYTVGVKGLNGNSSPLPCRDDTPQNLKPKTHHKPKPQINTTQNQPYNNKYEAKNIQHPTNQITKQLRLDYEAMVETYLENIFPKNRQALLLNKEKNEQNDLTN